MIKKYPFVKRVDIQGERDEMVKSSLFLFHYMQITDITNKPLNTNIVSMAYSTLNTSKQYET